MKVQSLLKTVARSIYYAIPSPYLRRKAMSGVTLPFRNRVVRRDLGGYVAELHLGEIMEFSAFLGSFERTLVERIDALAAPGMVVLDIGANVGLHTLRFASRVRPGGKVYAFEPTGFAYRKLVRNVQLNPGLEIEPLQLALSNEAARGVEISFRSSWRFDGSRADEGRSRVDFQRLDDWADERGLTRLDIIKMDVDGFEGLVLEGGYQTVSRFRPDMLVEASIDQYGKGRPDAFAILEELGYRFELVSDGSIVTSASIPERLSAMAAQGQESFNVLARCRDRRSLGGQA